MKRAEHKLRMEDDVLHFCVTSIPTLNPHLVVVLLLSRGNKKNALVTFPGYGPATKQ